MMQTRFITDNGQQSKLNVIRLNLYIRRFFRIEFALTTLIDYFKLFRTLYGAEFVMK